MANVLPFLLAGLATGAVYGMTGIGLVLTYKTSGVFNFAYGALASVSAYAFYELYVVHGLSWPIAAAISILVVGVVVGFLLELLARSVQTAGFALQVAAMVGLLVAIESGLQLIFGNAEQRQVPVFLGSSTVSIFGTAVQWSEIVTFLIAISVTVALSLYFRVSRRGVEMRALVDDPELLATLGSSPRDTRRRAWVIGSIIVSACGVLFAPLLPLNPEQLSLLVVAAFGAAAIGAFSSLPLTLVGGLGIGILASFSTSWFTSGVLSGVPPSLPFIVLFFVLLFFPKRHLIGRAFTVPRLQSTWKAPIGLQVLGGAVLLVLLGFVPSIAGVHQLAWTSALGTVLVFLSLSLLVRCSGQVSLCQVSFVAIGAVAFCHLAGDHHVPWFAALGLAGLIAVPVGAVLSIPAIRLSGLYLALATFGFGILLQYMFYSENFMFGETGTALTAPRPHLSFVNVSSDRGFYYLALFLVAVAFVVVTILNNGRLGRLMRGVADSPTILSTNGTNVQVTQVLVFCIAAFLAAIGGAVVGVAQTTVSAESYDSLTSLVFFVVIIIVAGGVMWGAVIAAISSVVLPSYLTASATAGTALQLLFGASAIVVAILPTAARGVPVSLQKRIDGLFHRSGPGSEKVPISPLHDVERSDVGDVQGDQEQEKVLSIEGLVVRFGGIVAVDGVSLRVPRRRITGLIGPNGAGKTTTFNACSGLIRPSAGEVAINGVNVTRRSSASRARMGLGRTFQKMELLESLPVWDNVAIGAEAGYAGKNPFAHLLSSRHTAEKVRDATVRAIEMCELAGLEGTHVSSLSTGQRRLVELARCLAGEFDILLLDEPASGLDREETARFAEILNGVVRKRGIGILLVEHDMSFALSACDHIYVLDFGRPIFEGSAREVRESRIVRDAYLGDNDLESELESAEAFDRASDLATPTAVEVP